MEELRPHGWHNGYWRDKETGMDNGLIQLFKNGTEPNSRIAGLATVVRVLQNEAEAIHNGVAVVWHPEIDENLTMAATNSKVIPITVNGGREALDIWEEIKQTMALPVFGERHAEHHP
jgi:hypothetical protein